MKQCVNCRNVNITKMIWRQACEEFKATIYYQIFHKTVFYCYNWLLGTLPSYYIQIRHLWIVEIFVEQCHWMIFQEGYKQARLNVESFLNCKAVILDWSVYLSWCIYSVWLRESCSMKGTLFCILLMIFVGKLFTFSEDAVHSLSNKSKSV